MRRYKAKLDPAAALEFEKLVVRLQTGQLRGKDQIMAEFERVLGRDLNRAFLAELTQQNRPAAAGTAAAPSSSTSTTTTMPSGGPQTMSAVAKAAPLPAGLTQLQGLRKPPPAPPSAAPLPPGIVVLGSQLLVPAPGVQIRAAAGGAGAKQVATGEAEGAPQRKKLKASEELQMPTQAGGPAPAAPGGGPADSQTQVEDIKDLQDVMKIAGVSAKDEALGWPEGEEGEEGEEEGAGVEATPDPEFLALEPLRRRLEQCVQREGLRRADDACVPLLALAAQHFLRQMLEQLAQVARQRRGEQALRQEAVGSGLLEEAASFEPRRWLRQVEQREREERDRREALEKERLLREARATEAALRKHDEAAAQKLHEEISRVRQAEEESRRARSANLAALLAVGDRPRFLGPPPVLASHLPVPAPASAPAPSSAQSVSHAPAAAVSSTAPATTPPAAAAAAAPSVSAGPASPLAPLATPAPAPSVSPGVPQEGAPPVPVPFAPTTKLPASATLPPPVVQPPRSVKPHVPPPPASRFLQRRIGMKDLLFYLSRDPLLRTSRFYLSLRLPAAK